MRSVFSRDYGIFIEQLRLARKSSGLTQAQVAERLDQSQSFVSKCESGERRMDVIELRAYCLAIEQPILCFLADLEEKLCTGTEG